MARTSNLVPLFERYANGGSHHEAFSALLDHFISSFSTHPAREPLAAADAARMLPLLEAIGEGAEGFRDPLGEIYMELLSKGRNGQYFTPEPLGELMVRCTIPGEAKGQRVFDPACGSGRLLLAAAKIDRSRLLYGADSDLTCCRMAVANMLLHSLTAEIVHMDSLSGRFFQGFRTGTTVVGGYHVPWVTPFAERAESYVWRAGGYESKGGKDE
ncbi:HsdM family class I SAM-dependent methyltransferase [Mucilaginibacter sp. HD30]